MSGKTTGQQSAATGSPRSLPCATAAVAAGIAVARQGHGGRRPAPAPAGLRHGAARPPLATNADHEEASRTSGSAARRGAGAAWRLTGAVARSAWAAPCAEPGRFPTRFGSSLGAAADKPEAQPRLMSNRTAGPGQSPGCGGSNGDWARWRLGRPRKLRRNPEICGVTSSGCCDLARYRLLGPRDGLGRPAKPPSRRIARALI